MGNLIILAGPTTTSSNVLPVFGSKINFLGPLGPLSIKVLSLIPTFSNALSTFVLGSQNDPMVMPEDEFAQNIEFETEGDDILNFSESNPFGEVGNRTS